MADLVLSVAKSVVDVTLTKAQSAIDEEEELWQRAQHDLVFITGEFQMMQSILEVINEERAKNKVVRTWVRLVRELAYDVEDGIEFVVHLDNKSTWWRRMLPRCIAPPMLLDRAVADIKQLKDRVEDVSQKNMRYNLINETGSEQVMQQRIGSTGAAAVGATAHDMLIEWRAKSKKHHSLGDLITKWMAKEDSDLGVISVWEKDGDLARTSIIRKAYQDPEICRNFGCRGWVKLTHPLDPHKFIQSLVAQFYVNSCLQLGTTADVAELKRMEMTQGDGLIGELMNQVNNKRYLLVLEEVCTMGEWDTIRACLPVTEKGSCIIVSTEQYNIARLCIGHSYQVLELASVELEHPVSVRVFFEEGSQSNEAILDYPPHYGIPNSKRNEACDWTSRFQLVGRESQVNELRNYQTKARFDNCQVMSVWGIPGVGKSTLVRSLYYNRMLETQLYDKYGWVDVSHPFNLRDVCESLLSDFDSESLPPMGINNPIYQCKKLLKDNRCFVVINGLQSKDDWDLIEPDLVSRHSKSIIVVVTTEESIATHCADNEELLFNLKGLEAQAALDLFKAEVHRRNPLFTLNAEDTELQQLIAKCGGLPKVIVAIAEFLAPKTVTCLASIRAMNNRFMGELENKPDFGSLRRLFGWMDSYIRTCPDFLKRCILYLSVFPECHGIRRRRLVRRWIAEGYIKDTEDGSAEEKGEISFSRLVDFSILQRLQHSNTNECSYTGMVLCQTNSFVGQYILSRPTEEKLVLDLVGRCPLTTGRTGRHLTIRESWDRDRDRAVFDCIDFSRLRSLTVFGRWESFFISESMKVLRVLDLEDASGVTDKDLKQIVKLFHRLKFLSLRGCSGICNLPASLGNLRQLETLDIRKTSVVTMPETITKLKKLRYIRAGTTEETSTTCNLVDQVSKFHGRRQLDGVKVPKEIGELSKLHTLGVVNVSTAGGRAIQKEFGNLTQLRKLGVSGINKKNCKEFCSAISGHAYLESLSVRFNEDNLNCLGGISSPLDNLQSLKLYGFVKQLRQWIRYFPKVTKLDLEITISSEVISVLGDLRELRILRLCATPLRDGDGKIDFCVRINGEEQRCYPSVKVLQIACSSSLHVSFGSEAMQNLELLTARCSSGSTWHFEELKCLRKLKEVRLIGFNADALKDLKQQLAEHPRKPTLKMEN